MGQYKTFAGVYDILMRDIDYRAWYKYLLKIWERYGENPRLVLDLGCGTGTLSIMLSKKGYEIIGVDSSSEMLAVAEEKAKRKRQEILFLNQEMENFELYGTVDSIISLFDCINYIVKKDGLFNVFKLAANYLNPGGLFIFDINTLYKYEKILGDNIFAENDEECSYIWENYFNKSKKINEYTLNLFIKNNEGLYEKSTEYHYQRAYGINTVALMLKCAGFDVLSIFDAYTFKRAHKCSERVFFVARNGGK